jgi:glycosyltransferase involved in cell wall biosynthesis
VTEPEQFHTFAFLGRLGQRNGVYDLLKAIELLVFTYGKRNVKFLLAGDGEHDLVRKVIEDRNLSGYVELFDWLGSEEKRNILRMAQTVVLPSYEENLPMALIEGMACGKVVISTYVGGIPDLVENGVNGYLFEAGDAKELARLLAFVNEHPAVVKPIVRQNIQTIHEYFNLDKLAIRLNEIYKSVAEQPRRVQ